jgi:hypothetical protein
VRAQALPPDTALRGLWLSQQQMRRAAVGLACAALIAELACHKDANIYTVHGAVNVTLFQVHDSRGEVLWKKP